MARPVPHSKQNQFSVLYQDANFTSINCRRSGFDILSDEDDSICSIARPGASPNANSSRVNTLPHAITSCLDLDESFSYSTEEESPVLGEISGNAGTPRKIVSSLVDSLATDLQKLHLRESQSPSPRIVTRSTRSRPIVASDTFEPPSRDSSWEEVQAPCHSSRVSRLLKGKQRGTSSPSRTHPGSVHARLAHEQVEIQSHSAKEPTVLFLPAGVQPVQGAGAHLQPPACLPSFEEQIARQQAGQFEWLLVLSSSGYSAKDPKRSGNDLPPCPVGRKIRYGCNLLWHSQDFHDPRDQERPRTNTCSILATKLDEGYCCIREEYQVVGRQMAAQQVEGTAIEEQTINGESLPQEGHPNGLVSGYSNDQTGTPSQGQTVSHATGYVNQFREPTAPSSPASRPRIEDSIEEIDKFADELEKVNELANVGRVISPPASPQKSPAGRGVKEKRLGAPSPPTKKAASVRPQAATLRVKRSSTVRPALKRSNSFSLETMGPAARAHADSSAPAQTKSTTKKTAAGRPLSLLPPKPLAKSGKAPTKSTFELPGEAVARRLKEAREARLSKQFNAEDAAQALQALSLPRAKSTRLPTIPSFELPGEAISRRKREERDARLKREAEEEQRQRQFKARPVPSCIPSSVPRDTITSRARQTKPHKEEAGRASDSPSKRFSTVTAPRSSLSPSVSGRSPQSRGRGTSTVTSHMSRATSVSASSVCGKGSTASTEDLQQQKLRGRDIYERDNEFVHNKEREKRDRELMAKLAREEAAERSRQAGREWAEKQRRKQLAAAAQSTVMG